MDSSISNQALLHRNEIAASNSFQLDTSAIPQTSHFRDVDELRDLGLRAYDQSQVEQSVLNQIDEAIRKNEWAQRVKFANRSVVTLNKKLKAKQEELRTSKSDSQRVALQGEVNALRRNVIEAQKLLTRLLSSDGTAAADQMIQIPNLEQLETSQPHNVMKKPCDGSVPSTSATSSTTNKVSESSNIFQKVSEVETERERLIRLGEITPLDDASQSQPALPTGSHTPVHSSVDNWAVTVKKERRNRSGSETDSGSDSEYLPSDVDAEEYRRKVKTADVKAPVAKGKRKRALTSTRVRGTKRKREASKDEDDSAGVDGLIDEADDDNHEESNEQSEVEEEADGARSGKQRREKLNRLDDSDDHVYESRLREYRKRCIANRELLKQTAEEDAQSSSLRSDLAGLHASCSDAEWDYVCLENGFRVPRAIWSRLFKYQQTGVRWLLQLHLKRCGGVIGDEMGLGKTIQIVAFLATLRCSNRFRSQMRAETSSFSAGDSKKWSSWKSNEAQQIVDEGSDLGAQTTLRREVKEYGSLLGPVLIVCPATVLFQWMSELHSWHPPFRVLMLHASSPNRRLSDKALIRLAGEQHCVLLTTYQTLRLRQHELLRVKWHYVILDEGQQIRNPDTQTNVVCKQFDTPHRLVLSGCPIQNNLRELWSLFDFVFPGLLGLLADFEQHFAVPIVQGGYANASEVEVESAYRCACVLRDTISPYLLRRVKADVNASLKLPNKTEQVLFCRLTKEQRTAYKKVLSDPICQQVTLSDCATESERRRLRASGSGRCEGQLFAMIVLLRKVCNHPHLLQLSKHKQFSNQSQQRDSMLAILNQSDFGDWHLSGKMMVLHNLLRIWHAQQHKVLLFAQTRQVLSVLEKYVRQVCNYTYLRMDGTTPISQRQSLIKQYNSSPDIFVFLLTTRVGGVGVNLIGANRVVLFEPDWNPTTDEQARERVWRIGQTRDVTVYRLLTSGTIEEKIYHRQIFKHFLTNRILADPRQRRFFKTNGLKELFTLNDESDDDQQQELSLARSQKKSSRRNETGVVFAGTDIEIDLKRIKKDTDQAFRDAKAQTGDLEQQELQRKAKARELARKLNQKFALSYLNKDDVKPSFATASQPSTSQQSGREHEKKRSKVTVDGQRVDNVTKKRTWRGDQQAASSETQKGGVKDDDFVLSALLRSNKTKNVLHSALRHDRIVDADGEMNADELLIRRAADRVARSAVEALERSRTLYPQLHPPPVYSRSSPSVGPKARFGLKKNPALTSTTCPAAQLLTDSNASASASLGGCLPGCAPVQSPASNLLSSAQIMKEIRDRDSLRPVKVKNNGDQQSLTCPRDSDFYTTLLNDVRDFIATQMPSSSRTLFGGQATTQQIVDRFRDRVGTDVDDLETFKRMLRRICVFQRNGDGVGYWRLKTEFE